MTDTVAPEPTPEQAALFARVRRMMLIAGLTSALAVAVVLIAVGYRLYRGEGSPAVLSDITAVRTAATASAEVRPAISIIRRTRANNAACSGVGSGATVSVMQRLFFGTRHFFG